MVWLKKAFYPAGNYMFKVDNRNTRTRCEICSKLTMKIPERRQWRFTPCSSISINFKQVNANWVRLKTKQQSEISQAKRYILYNSGNIVCFYRFFLRKNIWKFKKSVRQFIFKSCMNSGLHQLRSFWCFCC